MEYLYSKLCLVLIGTLLFTGCKDESGNFQVGVSLGGTGTGGSTAPRPDITPDQMESDDLLYAVAYPNPIIQNCNGIERTIQFVRHYPPQLTMQMGDRVDLYGLKNAVPIKFRLQVIVKNTNSFPVYEFINSCKSAFKLTATKTTKVTQTDYCLNEETINTYEPNETRTYNYTFNLPNILQNWTTSYDAQYSKQLFEDTLKDDYKLRMSCDPLTTTLLIDEFPSSRDGAPPSSPFIDGDNSSDSTNDSSPVDSYQPPIFGGFDLGDEP